MKIVIVNLDILRILAPKIVKNAILNVLLVVVLPVTVLLVMILLNELMIVLVPVFQGIGMMEMKPVKTVILTVKHVIMEPLVYLVRPLSLPDQDKIVYVP